MKTFFSLAWWVLYILSALIIQQHIPGIDALVPGFLLTLQEKKPRQSLWLFIIFVLIQEGAGSLTFGGAILWYMGQVALFRFSQSFFVADNIVFVLMLSASLGAYHGFLTWLMCAVQKIPMDYALVIQESLIQAAIIPVIWGIAYLTRPKKTAATG